MKKTMINSNLMRIRPSTSIAMMDKARTLQAKGYDVISLAGGEPDFDTPKPICEVGIKGIREGHTHYTAGRGINPLRERIAKKLNDENGIRSNVDNILVTPGGKYAIFLAINTFINPGDKVMVLDPSWVSYKPMVEMAGGDVVSVPLSLENNYKIDRDLLNKYMDPNVRILIINTPNNPTGRVLSLEEAKTIEEFVADNNILLISDEVYEKIIFDGHKHISMGSFASIADKVITVNSFSKCVAMTGWRVGYMCAETSIIDAVYLYYQHTLTCVSEFSQLAALEALEHNAEMNEMCHSYEKRRDIFINSLNSIRGIKCLKPEGAFYAWCKVEKSGIKPDKVSEFLLEKARVVTVAGSAYGLETEGCVRMSFAAAEKDLIEAAGRIAAAMK